MYGNDAGDAKYYPLYDSIESGMFVCLCVYVIYTTYLPNVVDLVGFPLLMAQLVAVHLTLYQR